MISYTYNLDLTPGGALLFVPLKQYEDSAQIEFKLFTRIGNFSLPNGTKVYVRGTKEDGNGFSYDEASGKVKLNAKKDAVILSIDKQMTAVKGKVFCEFVFKNANGKELITASFALKVYRSALDEDTIISESVIKEIKDAIVDAYIEDSNLYLVNNDNVILGPYPLNSIQIVETSSDLDEDAPIGSVAVVLSKSEKEVEVSMPKQSESEEAKEVLDYRRFKFANATFDEENILSLIMKGPENFGAEFGLTYDDDTKVEVKIVPAVSNLNDNIYIEHGGFSSDDLLQIGVGVADNITKCYVVNLNIDLEFEDIKPEAIIRIDNTHVSIPVSFLYAFEDVDNVVIMAAEHGGVYQVGPFDFKEGYNSIRYILDESTGEIDEESMYVTKEDPNDCFYIDPAPSVNEVKLYVEGWYASLIYKGILHSFGETDRGLFIKYEDGWAPAGSGSGSTEEIEEKIDELEESVSALQDDVSNIENDVSNLQIHSHWHENKELLDRLSGNEEDLHIGALDNDHKIKTILQPCARTILRDTLLSPIVVRDELIHDSNGGISNVPVYCYTSQSFSGIVDLISLWRQENESTFENSDSITLVEKICEETHVPVRILRFWFFDNFECWYIPNTVVWQGRWFEKGWYDRYFNLMENPQLSLQPNMLRINGVDYGLQDSGSIGGVFYDKMILSMSQCINHYDPADVSFAYGGFGHLVYEEGLVERLPLKIKNGHSYWFDAIVGSTVGFSRIIDEVDLSTSDESLFGDWKCTIYIMSGGNVTFDFNGANVRFVNGIAPAGVGGYHKMVLQYSAVHGFWLIDDEVFNYSEVS